MTVLDYNGVHLCIARRRSDLSDPKVPWARYVKFRSKAADLFAQVSGMTETGAIGGVHNASDGLLERAAGAYRSRIVNRSSIATAQDSVELSPEAIFLFMSEGNYYANVEAIQTENGISRVFLQIQS